MDKAFLVGLTGIIGGGKSTAAKILESIGAFRISSDEIARKYSDPDSPIRDELVRELGEEILSESGKPDRKKIAKVVFEDPKKLEALNRLIHPRVRAEFQSVLEGLTENTLVIWEVPLLFETDAFEICDKTVCVLSDPESSLKRVVSRDGISLKEATARMNSQLPIEEKAKRADYVIRNLGTLRELEQECKRIFKQLRG
nr:dephospho-CoA kinase [Leptospira perolatii]